MQIFSFEYLKGNMNKHSKGTAACNAGLNDLLHALEDIRSWMEHPDSRHGSLTQALTWDNGEACRAFAKCEDWISSLPATSAIACASFKIR